MFRIRTRAEKIADNYIQSCIDLASSASKECQKLSPDFPPPLFVKEINDYCEEICDQIMPQQPRL